MFSKSKYLEWRKHVEKYSFDNKVVKFQGKSYYNANKKTRNYLQPKNTRTRGFQKTQVCSNDREICGDGVEPHKDRHSQWVYKLFLIYLFTLC